MATEELKPGDIVRCINTDRIRNGQLTIWKTYTVVRTFTDVVTIITDDGEDRGYMRWRFDKIADAPVQEEAETTQAPKDIQVGGGHYKDLPIQPIEYCIRNGIPFAEGNVIKYVTRWRKKNGIEDLKKARHMLDIIIHEAEQETHNAI